jgi:peptidoglycan/LPS O-acetylase OafA/YrhL
MKTTEQGTYIPSLDGLRFIAILLVFLSHVQNTAQMPRMVPGNFGVTLFFFLSGYLITTLMRTELERTGTVSFKLFYLRRTLRIFPTFYLVLGGAALYGWYVGTMDPWWLFGQALHITNYQVITGGWTAPIAPNTEVYWSLAVEEHFYLVFPMVFVLLARYVPRTKRAHALLGLCAIVLLWRCWLVYGTGSAPDRTYLATDTRIDSILFGCALALWGNPALDDSSISESTWKYVLLPLSVAGLLVSFAIPYRSFRETFGYSLQGICLFAVFTVAVRYPQWGVMRLLNQRHVRLLGAMSFAIYLIHPTALFVSERLVGTALLPLFATATALTLASSALLYYGIERPIGRLRKRLH